MSSYVLGEFAAPARMVSAARSLRALGYTGLDAYSPYPLESAEEAIGAKRSRIPLVVLVCGLSGTLLAFLMQWWCNAIDYPINVGGRPLVSLPADVPIMFELTVLFAAGSAFVAVFAFSRLPALWHPVFELPEFRSASIDRFWVSVAFDGSEGDRRRIVETIERAGGAVHGVEVPP